MSTGAYAFLLFEDPEHLVPGIETVKTMPAVTGWHAVDGHFHLVLTLAEADNGLRARLLEVPGVQDLRFCTVEKELVGGFTADVDSCHAWLTVEIDAEQRDNIEQALQELGRLSAGNGGARLGALAFVDCGVVAALSGESFEAVDAAVERHIRPLDGVLRVKREWIIDLTQL
jgi:hypothetical protein